MFETVRSLIPPFLLLSSFIFADVGPVCCGLFAILTALSLAMSRDGSSGGVIRMAVIKKDGVERKFFAGDDIPKFWEGKEILPPTVPGKDVAGVRTVVA